MDEITRRTLPDGSVIDADLCIVGAGAAGTSLALPVVPLGRARHGFRRARARPIVSTTFRADPRP
jgi:hypothetical protein